MYELYFRLHVDRGLQELDAGQTVAHDKVVQILARRLQSSR